MPAELIMRSLREAIVSMLAALATMLCALAIDPEPGPAILAIVLCLSLSRSQLERDRRGRIEAAVALPAVGMAALGVAMLLHRAPWIGALAFVAAMSLSIWLRRFGPRVRRAGALVALPFVVILTTPYVPATRVGHAVALLLPIVVALLALLWVSVCHTLARRLRWLPAARPSHRPHGTAARAGSLRPVASTRMAVQMAVALAAAFVVGYVFFAERWAWIVLTAYIVNSGNQGRLDVAYKSLLRVLGAGAGTLLALVFAVHTGPHGPAVVGLMLAAVFLGLWLRPLGYAWWALFVTLALALLQGFEGAGAAQVLSLRLEEIAIGAVIGVAAAWLVWPVRSTAVLRSRLAESLASLAQALDPAAAPCRPDGFIAALDRLESIAPAFRAARRLGGRLLAVQPADWIDAMLACRASAVALIEDGAAPAEVRKAVGAARKAMREPGQIQPALLQLRHALAAPNADRPRQRPAPPPLPQTSHRTTGTEHAH